MIDKAIDLVFGIVDSYNDHISTTEPWKIKDIKGKLELIIGSYLAGIKYIGEKLAPFLPETSEKILKIFESEKIIKA